MTLIRHPKMTKYCPVGETFLMKSDDIMFCKGQVTPLDVCSVLTYTNGGGNQVGPFIQLWPNAITL